MLFHEVRESVDEATATASRTAKIDAVARLLARADPEELPVVVGFLLARPRQGRIGIGWRTLSDISAESAPAPTATVADVDAALDALAQAGGDGVGVRRAEILDALAIRTTAEEWDLLRRIVLGELRSGALEGVVLDAIARASGHPGVAVRRAAMLSGDLGETARLAMTGTADDLTAVGLVVGRGVLPMLASTAPSVTDALAGFDGPAAVEYKLDGARVQVHRDGEDVRVFTRSLADITARVPEIVAAARALPAERVILDGETLALDEDGGPRPFQDTMARFGSAADAQTLLRPWFFDLLHLDGADLLDAPLAERRAALAALVGDQIIPALHTADPEAGERFAREALAAGHEGVMVKALDAPYAAGRRGKSWLKVKPVLTFDLVVLAAEWGSGRRTGLLSNLHLGARDPEGEYGEPGGFVMVGKTFKGLTDETLRWQSAHFPTIETRRTASAVHLRPETVVEIAIDGVQRSTRYPGGVALRFARVKGYRPDKDAREADTIGALRALLRP